MSHWGHHVCSHHKGTGAFAESCVWIADDSDSRDLRMLEKQSFHLDDRNFFAATDNNVLGATGNSDIALCIHAGEIAGIEPAIGVGVVEFRGPTQSGTTVVTTRCTKGEDKPSSVSACREQA